jgi:hypothetical protein
MGCIQGGDGGRLKHLEIDPAFLSVESRADFGPAGETVKDFAYFAKEQLG